MLPRLPEFPQAPVPSSPPSSVSKTEDVASSPSKSFKVTEMSQSSFLDLVTYGSFYLNITETTNPYSVQPDLPVPGGTSHSPLSPDSLLYTEGPQDVSLGSQCFVSGRAQFVSLVPSSMHAALLLQVIEDTFSRWIRSEKK